MTQKQYIDAKVIIKDIVDLAYGQHKLGNRSFILSRDSIIRREGNPTYINQYHEMLRRNGFKVTLLDGLNAKLDWGEDQFAERIAKEEEERRKKEEAEELFQRQKYIMNSPSHYEILMPSLFNREDIEVASSILTRLLKWTSNRESEVLITESDITNLRGDVDTMEEVANILTLLGVSNKLTNYRGIYDEYENKVITIDWQNSQLYKDTQ